MSRLYGAGSNNGEARPVGADTLVTELFGQDASPSLLRSIFGGLGLGGAIINVPAVGATVLTGVAAPNSVVSAYKGTSTTPIGTVLTDGVGGWSLALGSAVAAGDVYRVPGAVGVIIAGSTPPSTGGTLDFSDSANSGHIPGI